MLPKIDVPVFETSLVSTGEKVKYRPFLVKEQKLFMMAMESNDPKDQVIAIKQVLNNCILSKNVDVEELPTFDLEFLFLQLRSRSIGENVSLSYNCNNFVTGETGETKKCTGLVKFDLDLLELKPTVNPEHTNKIEITDKVGLVLKYPKFEDINANDNENELVKTIEIITKCIDFIYDDEQVYYAKDCKKEELVEFVENLQQDSLIKIQKFFATMPKLKKELEFKCPKCGYEEKLNVEGLQNFFA
jgi:DNA-directed RNA polymerase subunit M/transcription elongation factor TFIIS